ncbi:hypothetical protein ABZX85_45810 [Streptomyces sp. NPDC004539]|uniref:hypothetical protein n=1 Tax=Streptomyces sp. NPDC004539 TaxID=3154280 RepID=UPI0033A13190
MHAERQQRPAEPDHNRPLPQHIDQTRAAPTSPLSPATAHALQRTIGNAAVARLVDRQRHQHTPDGQHATPTQRLAEVMDDHTLRHELQHVRQQRSGQAPLGLSHPADESERDAENTATRLGRGVTAPAPAPAPASAQDGVVQRMVLKTSNDFFKSWAGQALNSPQKDWVLAQLQGIVGTAVAVKGLKNEEALKLLADKGVTKATMDAALGTPTATSSSSSSSSSSQAPASMADYEREADATIADAAVTWAKSATVPKLEKATFAIEGLGRGTVAMLKSASGPRHSHMLAWFSHGYEDRKPIAVGTERQYGFAVQVEQSLNRIGATPEVFASLPDALAGSAHAPTTNAPGEYVQPHKANEFGVELPSVFGLVGQCDVAMLLDFEWAPKVADEFNEAAKAGTPPLAVIIDRAPAFTHYNSLLIYACRTPWSVNAAVEGSSMLKAAMVKELVEQDVLPAEASRRAEERYVGAPQAGRVHE